MSLLFLNHSRQYSPVFVIARSVFRVKCNRTRLNTLFEGNKRVRSQTKLRSNLLSPINWQRVFKHLGKNHFTFSQSNEIASGIQECLAKSVFNMLLAEPRNGYAMKRSYEGYSEWRRPRFSYENCNFSDWVVKGTLYA